MRRTYSFIFFLCLTGFVFCQTPIAKSKIKQTIKGKTYYVHVVEKGQTVFSIARAYNLKYYDAIIKTDINKLSIGDTVWLPIRNITEEIPDNSTYKYVEVKTGQTLYSLSKTFNTTVSDIEKLNPDLKNTPLKVGMQIKVPLKDKDSESSSTTQAFSNSHTKSSETISSDVIKDTNKAFNFSIRDRVDKNKIHVTLMMPLFLDNMEEISTSKFDIDQRKRRDYKSFSFIQFYEGILLGLNHLKEQGYDIVLNVVDLPDDKPEKVVQAFSEYDIAKSDFIIAMLFHRSFEKAAELAKENKIFIINPLTTRGEIIKNNPYVIKYAPSIEGSVKSILSVVKKEYEHPHLYLIHSNSQSEKPWYNEFKKQLSGQKEIEYTLFDWAANSKLTQVLRNDQNNVVVNIYDQNPAKNKTYSSLLLNRLFSFKKSTPTLISITNFIDIYTDVYYMQLQRVNFHTINNTYLAYNNPIHKSFIDNFKDTYKTEPIGDYAGIGNDIIIHFVTGLQTKGSSFWEKPNIPISSNILYPMVFKRPDITSGFENQAAYIYKLDNYKLYLVNRKR